MESENLSVILRVRELPICRAFYRDVLGLGAPVIDSNFWVEFSLGNGKFLCLDATPGEPVPESTESRMSWIIHLDDPDGFCERMEANGYDCGKEMKEVFGCTVMKFKDPEGNPFYVSAEILSQDEKA